MIIILWAGAGIAVQSMLKKPPEAGHFKAAEEVIHSQFKRRLGESQVNDSLIENGMVAKRERKTR